MVKLARNSAIRVGVVKNSLTGQTIKKVRGAMIKKVDRFERCFPDGVYVEPSDKKRTKNKSKSIVRIL